MTGMSDTSPPPEEIARLKKAATALALTIGIIALGMKVGAWAVTHSVSVLSALMDSVLDSIMALVNFLAVRKALMPADRFHRFGFGKFEPLASLAQSAFIIGVAVVIAFEAVDRFIHPHPVANAELGIAAIAGVLALMIGLALYQQHVIRLTGSIVVRADSLHIKADVMMHMGVILSLLLSSFGSITWADSAIALFIAAFLAWNGMGIFTESMGILLDRELSDDERHKIRDIALSHPDIYGVHDLRTRSSGEQIFIQLHVEMKPDTPLSDAHQFVEEAVDSILEAYPNAEVQVHEEPVGMPRHRSWCRKAGLKHEPGEYGKSVRENSENHKNVE